MTKRNHDEGTKFLKFFGPLLDALRKLGGSGTPDEVVEKIAADLKLSDDIQNELLPSGGTRYRNQVAWARFYLVREGLLDSSKRGVWSLTERGRATDLSVGQAREIFSKWVKVFDEQRRAKAATQEPIAEQVAEGSGATSKDFRGAMAGRADKGIIITTGTFTAESRREATRDGVPQIELIDGEKILDMLETLELGLRPVTTYEVNHIFFNEFREG